MRLIAGHRDVNTTRLHTGLRRLRLLISIIIFLGSVFLAGNYAWKNFPQDPCNDLREIRFLLEQQERSAAQKSAPAPRGTGWVEGPNPSYDQWAAIREWKTSERQQQMAQYKCDNRAELMIRALLGYILLILVALLGPTLAFNAVIFVVIWLSRIALVPLANWLIAADKR